MNLEYAFARALAEHPESRLSGRIRRAIRHAHASPESARVHLPRREIQDLAYPWERLGRSWASFRLGGCTWVGPIDRLQTTWRAHCNAAWRARADTEDLADLVRHLALGIGLGEERLGCRERSYLLHVVSAWDTAHVERGVLPGIRFFSPLTLFAVAFGDLCDLSPEERAACHSSIASHVAAAHAPAYDARLRAACRAAATWLAERTSADGHLAAVGGGRPAAGG